MNMLSSDQLIKDLINTLEGEIQTEEKTLSHINFALKVKKARLKRLKSEYQGNKAPISEDKPT